MRTVKSTVAGFWLLAVVPVALILVLPAAAQNQEPKPNQKQQMVHLKRGQQLVLQLLTSLDSGRAQVGDDVSLKLFLPLTSDGVMILPAGWRVRGRITKVTRADKNCTQGKIAWQLDQISTADGSKITISLDITGEKPGKAIAARKRIAKVAKYTALPLFSPYLLLLWVGMHGEGSCRGAFGAEDDLPAGAVLSAVVSRDVLLHPVP
jgi:hypothetical protein